MVTLKFILGRISLVMAILPLLTLKKLWNLLVSIVYFLGKSERSTSHPSILILTLTTDCNFHCVMCLRSGEKRSPKDNMMDYKDPQEMDFVYLEALLREHAEYLCFVRLHGGEPLLYRNIEKLVILLNDLKIPYNVKTNGSLLTPELTNHLVGSHCFGIGISLDAATPEKYNRIRKGGDFAQVMGRIDDVNRLKDSRRSRRPILSAAMCTLKENAEEMVGLVRLCKQKRISSLSVTEAWDYETGRLCKDDFVPANTELVRRNVTLATNEAKRLGVNIHLNFPSVFGRKSSCSDNPSGLTTPTDCLNIYSSAWILPNFELMGCSNATHGFGNIRENPFAEVWNGSKFGYVRARNAFKRNSVPRECTGCIYSGSFFK